jgi:hypothetical protein
MPFRCRSSNIAATELAALAPSPTKRSPPELSAADRIAFPAAPVPPNAPCEPYQLF